VALNDHEEQVFKQRYIRILYLMHERSGENTDLGYAKIADF
jgi:hypothetical protein